MNNEQDTSDMDNASVSAALQSILKTDKFSASPQMSAFLNYVVEQTLLGNTRRIKAFTVGIEALGKSSSFDPQTDPSVRVLAKRLRSSLDAYYEQNPDTPVFIEMKPGSYIPRFILRSEMPAAAEPKDALAGDHAHKAMGTGAQNPSEGSPKAHVTVQQSAPENETDKTDGENSRKNNMNQLWQTYRSASKVA